MLRVINMSQSHVRSTCVLFRIHFTHQNVELWVYVLRVCETTRKIHTLGLVTATKIVISLLV